MIAFFHYVSLSVAFVDTWVNLEKMMLMFISHIKERITTRSVPFVAYCYVLFPTDAVLPTAQTIFISITKKSTLNSLLGVKNYKVLQNQLLDELKSCITPVNIKTTGSVLVHTPKYSK